MAVNVKGAFTVAIIGAVIDDVRSGQAMLTVPEIAGDETADVPPVFEAVMV